MKNAGKETVIIVHGTWAKPKPNEASWYQFPAGPMYKPNFVSKLNNALEKRGSPARCWAHCKDHSDAFTWSGENFWVDRTHAAFALARYINELQVEKWCCHIVAHSHGGNIVVEALPSIAQTGGPAGFRGTITTLGTPFIDVTSPVADKITKYRRRLFAITGPLYLIFVTICVVYLFKMDLNSYVVGIYYSTLFVILAIIIGLRHVRRHQRRGGWRRYWSDDGDKVFVKAFILSISSPMDEAWQLLRNIRRITNPLAPGSGVFAFLWKSHRANVRRNNDIARLQGVSLFFEQNYFHKLSVYLMWLLIVAASFIVFQDIPTNARQTGLESQLIKYLPFFMFLFGAPAFLIFLFGESFASTMLSPLSWIGRQGQAAIQVFKDIGTYIARIRSWPLLQQIAFGLEGYAYALPDATREPTFANSSIYVYEDLAPAAERRALLKREDWVKRTFSDVTETLAQMACPDLKTLLRMVETDLSLVHAAYYTDDECIGRIADWIADSAIVE
jgi:hypothetical protein